jgi:glycine oxidase
MRSAPHRCGRVRPGVGHELGNGSDRMSAAPKVVIVGGGVIGLSIAWRCAQRGFDVSLIDPAPGAGASWVAAGMLAPVAEAYQGEEALTALALESARRWPGFASELAGATGLDPGYTRHGTLMVARDRDDAAALQPLFALQQAAGLAAEALTSRQARRREPALASSVCGALWLPEDHQVDNRMLLRALLQACQSAAVGFVGERAVAISERSVTVSSGISIDADAVVIATGASVPSITLGGEAVGVPVRPVKGQIVRVQATAAAVFPTHSVRGAEVYIVPRSHGEIAIGATMEDKGFDVTVTAGAVMDLLRAAWELVPALSEAMFLEAIAGSRPGTPDNAPLLGPLAPTARPIGRAGEPETGGPIVAMGHFRNGLLLAPVTADAVSAMVSGAPVPDVVRPLDPRRFVQPGREAATA